MIKRIAIAVDDSEGIDLVARRLGRCSKFIVWELDAHDNIVSSETYFNPLAGQHTGACQIPGYLNQFNITAIITGGLGQQAVAKFFQYGINVITAPGLTAEEALRLFRQGILKGFESCLHDDGNMTDHRCA